MRLLLHRFNRFISERLKNIYVTYFKFLVRCVNLLSCNHRNYEKDLYLYFTKLIFAYT